MPKNATVFTRKADCLYDLRLPALMTQLLTYQIYSMFPYKEMTFRISIQDETKLCYLQVKNTESECPAEFVQDENTRVCSASDCVSDVRTRN